MSLEKIHLRKLLTLFYLPEKAQRSEVKDILKADLNKAAGIKSNARDFYSLFWLDAKAHVSGQSDILETTSQRVLRNKRYRRLYPELAKGFLRWWNEKRRWQNEPYKLVELDLATRLNLDKLELTVKIESLLSLQVGNSHRIIYPYFSEEPILGDEAARMGLWILKETLSDVDAANIRILDVLRGKSVGLLDLPLNGDEEKLFGQKYKKLKKIYMELGEE